MASRRRRLYHAISTIALPAAGIGAALTAFTATSAHAQAIGANLKVLSPRSGEALGANSFSLDVAFHSVSATAPVTTAELWVDGVRWARRDLDKPQVKNVLSFAVEGSTLSEGQHTLLVRVLCANGSVGEVVLPVTAGNDAGEVTGGPNGPEVTFQVPANGRRVMGRVELLVDSPSKRGVNPFVTIYVDKQFKTLMNMPPYTYSWDTTNVANGFHTIEATGYLESSNQSTTRRIRVLVDNPGGNTEYKKDIPDLSAGKSHSTAIASAAHTVALPAVPKAVVAGVHGTATRKTAGPLRTFTSAEVAVSPVKGLSPLFASGISTSWSSRSTEVSVAPAAEIAPVAPPAKAHVAPTAAHTELRSLVAKAKAAAREAGVATTPAAVTPSFALPSGTPRSIQPSPSNSSSPTAAGMSGLQALPTHSASGSTLILHFAAPRQVSGIRLLSATPAAIAMHSPTAAVLPSVVGSAHHHRAHRSHSGPRAILRPSADGVLNAIVSGKVTTVAFNGQQIAFDVQPRVEAGLPLAPFRQIFEHTGGQVDWAPQTQVVHAVNADKEIVITVGQSKASVNGEMLQMDRAAFVEKGRTIVPLTFVGAALNVKVNYDPATGRLQITSK